MQEINWFKMICSFKDRVAAYISLGYIKVESIKCTESGAKALSECINN